MAPSHEFDAVYEDCHRQVFALCRHLLGNADDAQDALQETFIAVARCLPQFRGESTVRTWVHRIALRVSLKLRARRGTSRDTTDGERDEGHDAPAQHAEADAVRHAMDRLSFEHRTVLSLFGVAGLTHAEIAGVLDIPEGTVWSRLHHAKTLFAAALAADASVGSAERGGTPATRQRASARAR